MDKKVNLEWLDRVAFGLKENKSYKELRGELENYLEDKILGAETRRKHINVLLRIWVSVLPEHEELRDRALALLLVSEARERSVLHWGLCLLAYELFRDVATIIGKLFTLNDELALAQVHKRVIEAWGDRTNLKYAVQRLLRTMANWGVLQPLGKNGLYRQTGKLLIENKPLKLWLLECYFSCIEQKSVSMQSLNAAPTLFPFMLEVNLDDLMASGRYEVNRQGLDIDVVELR